MSLRRRQQAGRRAGFTMVELTISALILSMMMGFLLVVQTTGQSAADEAGLQDEADARLTQTLERVANDLRTVIDSSIWEDLEGAPAGSDTITFQPLASLDGGVATPGPVVRFAVELEDAELSNDVDDDGDGLVDEGALYVVTDVGGAGEKRAIICKGLLEYYTDEVPNLADDNGNGLVDEPGFHVERDGDRLTVRLAIEVARSDGARVQRSGEISIRIRN